LPLLRDPEPDSLLIRPEGPLVRKMRQAASRASADQCLGRLVYSRLEIVLRRHFRRKVGYKLEFDNVVSAGFDFSRLCSALSALVTAENGGVPDPRLPEAHRQVPGDQ
jgi:hypothetical protein